MKQNIHDVREWDRFLIPYTQTVEELKIKFKSIRNGYREVSEYSPIEFITGRVKKVSSILEKSKQMLEQSIQAEEPEKALRVFVSFFKRNAVQMRKFMESRKRDRAVRILIDALIQYLRGVIERYKSPEIKIDYDDMEVMLRFFACGMMGILIHYADNPQLSEEKLIEQIRRILTGRLVPGKQDPPQ